MWRLHWNIRTGIADVIPLGDEIDHTFGEDCVCGPTIEPVARKDGSSGCMYVHHSLDGREKKE